MMKKIFKIDNKKYIFSSKYDEFNNLYGVTNEDKLEIDKKIENALSFYKDSFIEIDGINKISLFDLSRSANIQPAKYHGETYNRVNALKEYANDIGFDTPIFITLTSPSCFKPLKQIKLKNYIKLVDNPKFTGEFDYVRLARDYISNQWRKFSNNRIFRDIKSKYGTGAIFLRTYEPHLDGCPHSHIVVFIPSEFKERFIKLAKNFFKTKTDIKSEFNGDLGGVIAYILKYVCKSFKNGKNGKLCDVAYWYSKNCIRRFSTSRTLIPMYIYRKIIRDSKFRDLRKMTNLYKDGFISLDLIADNDKFLKKNKLLSKDYKIATIIISIEGFNYLEHHIAYKRSLNITIDLSNKEKESSNQIKNSREEFKKSIQIKSKQGNFKSKSEKFKDYIKKQDELKQLPLRLQDPKKLTDYELIELYRMMKKCNLIVENEVLKFGFIENELIKRNLGGITTFNKLIQGSTKEDYILNYANAGLCDLPF